MLIACQYPFSKPFISYPQYCKVCDFLLYFCTMEEVESTGRKRVKPQGNKFNVLPKMDNLNGKIPPQDVEMEKVVLGAILLEKNALTQVVDILKPEVFYSAQHQLIYNAIQSLFSSSNPIDILTVTAQLQKTGELVSAGGAYYISSLTTRVGSSAHVEYHARILLQKHIQRSLIAVSSNIITEAYEDTTDVFDLLDTAESNIFKVSEGLIGKEIIPMQALVGQAIKDVEAAKNHGTGITGVESGFTSLDRVTSGWQKSDLIILAARPGMGKTAFVLSMARNAAVEFKRPVALFSLEMASLQLVNRLVSSETGISVEKMKKGTLEDHEFEQLNALSGKLAEAPLYIDDTPALSVFQLRAKARRLKAQFDISMIIIDYLQLMTVGGDNKSGNREQEISTISRSLKGIAKELNVPVIALSQLSRAVETRGGTKRPQLSDLRESGAIEQDADMVCFIYRPDYYGFDADESGNPYPQGLTEIIIAKHRNGALEDIPLRFIGALSKFTDLAPNEYGNMPAGDGGAGFGGGLNPSVSFDGPPTVVFQSKMNGPGGEPPFGSSPMPGEEAPF